jgi:methyltransferase
VRHPNYLIVAAELAILPLAFDAIAIAVVFSLGNGVVLARRIRFEGEALRFASYHNRETLPRRFSTGQ